MTDKREKCSVKQQDFVEPCTTLEETINNNAPAFSNRKGVAVWNMRRREGGKSVPSRTFFGLICEAYPKGVAFNHCPFCGEDISAPFFAKGDEAAA
ncbi:MAG: hypothetical protein ACK4SQ_14475 [Allorhizobium sp.]